MDQSQPWAIVAERHRCRKTPTMQVSALMRWLLRSLTKNYRTKRKEVRIPMRRSRKSSSQKGLHNKFPIVNE
ncbi:MAG TPA: hypothetical protein VKV30_07050, partial [Candidatus Angelobacter sp.]|nr:hypothetical protein [Candidatus Angelobacter sp.]